MAEAKDLFLTIGPIKFWEVNCMEAVNFVPWTKINEGNLYEGEMFNGKFHGRGVLIKPNKYCLIAIFDNGRPHGNFLKISAETMNITSGQNINGK